MAKITIVNPQPELTSIADLAKYSVDKKGFPLDGFKSEELNIYQVAEIIKSNWPFELARFEFEYATGYSGYFKDGSEIHVGAWAECDELQAEKYKF